MAVSNEYTLGLLNSWAARMGVPIYHFNQVTGQALNAALTTAGQIPYVQQEREYINEGIVSALALALPYLRFYPRPVFLSQKLKINPYNRYSWNSIRLPWGYVQAIGQRAVTVIDAAATVSYEPALAVLNDRHNAVITVTVPAGTDADEIAVFFQQADRPDGFIDSDEVADDRWRIEPVRVTVSGTTCTIRGHRALFTNPALWAAPYDGPNFNWNSKNVGEVGDVATFVTAVSVCRVYADATNAVQLRYKDCNNLWQSMSGEAEIENAQFGTIDLTNRGDTCYYFTEVEVHYLAGMPLVNGEIRRDLQTALLRLGNCNMPLYPNQTDDRRTAVWQNDIGVPTTDGTQRIEKSTPFGSREGELYAWRIVDNLALPYAAPSGRPY